MRFSPDLFNLYSEMILIELKDLPGLVVGRPNTKNIRFADDTMFIADSEEKLKESLGKVVEESKNKGLTSNCKKQNVS